MKAVLFMSCAIATLAYSAAGYAVHNDNPLDGVVEQNGDNDQLTKAIRFVAHAGRGLISGYRRGMYKDNNFRIDAKCLDSNTEK